MTYTVANSVTKNSNVGTTGVITVGGTVTGAGTNNYNVTLQNGTLTVTKATLTVTANNASRNFGEANPFTGTITGFKLNEGESVLDTAPSYTTTANLNSPAGSYAITGGNGSDDNYAFSYIDGTLTITPAPATTSAVMTVAEMPNTVVIVTQDPPLATADVFDIPGTQTQENDVVFAEPDELMGEMIEISPELMRLFNLDDDEEI